MSVSVQHLDHPCCCMLSIMVLHLQWLLFMRWERRVAGQESETGLFDMEIESLHGIVYVLLTCV